MATLYDFFLAHAGADAAAAERLYDLLVTQARVFLDCRSLVLGDDWDKALPEAQRHSRVTVVLVSGNTDGAFYQREEIAAAIDLARNGDRAHRVVPVYLGSSPANVPYGLRLKHGLTVSGLLPIEEAAARLLELHRSLTAQAAGSGPERVTTRPKQARPDADPGPAIQEKVGIDHGSGEEPTPDEFRQDLAVLLRKLDEQARAGRLPPYLPPGADVADLARTVQIRPGIRTGKLGRSSAGLGEAGRGAGPDGMNAEDVADEAYGLPADRREEFVSSRMWPEVAAEYRLLMVLADPGLGKSWLIRTETHRLATQALARLKAGPVDVIIPMPVRCDQLTAAPGRDLAGKAAANLVGMGLLPERSRVALAAKIRGGDAVLLLDALDELPAPERGPFRELARSWAELAGDCARCVITSRIAGYTGAPLPGVTVVELQPFTPADVRAALEAWHLPPQAARRLLDRAADPAVAAMTRIPLLLALLCALTIELPAAESLPRTRGQLYDRVLRWFLTREHRVADNPRATALEDFEVGGLFDLLAPVAFTFAATSEGWIDLMPADRLLAAIRSAGPAFSERQSRADQVLRELSVDAGIFVPAGDPSVGRNPPYLFLHRTVAEYLVARYLATLPPAGRLAVVEQHRWFDSDWTQVIPMLGELLTAAEARALIEHLLAEQADPFHHSLFTALQVLGARADADHLLPTTPAAQLSGRVVSLLRLGRTRPAITSQVEAMTYLPRALLDLLLESLGHHSWSVRSAAAAALAGRDDPAVANALMHCLSDPDGGVRGAAVQALAGRADSRVAAAVTDRLRDGSWAVRRAAAKALSEYDDSATAVALADHLGDRNQEVRRAAAKALAGRNDSAAIRTLADHLGRHYRDVRREIVNALAKRSDSAATAALKRYLSDRDQSVRNATMRALAASGDPAAIAILMRHLSNTSPQVRRDVVRILTEHYEPTINDALMHCLGGSDRDARRTAAMALAGCSEPVVTAALVERLNDPDPAVRFAATGALGGRDDPAVTAALINRLTDGSAAVRAKVTRELGGRDDLALTKVLVQVVGDPDPEVRRAAIGALAGRNDPAVTAVLMDRLADTDGPVRDAAVQALGGCDDPAVTAALMDRLRNRDGNGRSGAMRALAGRDDPAVTAALTEGLRDQNADVRVAAVEALAGRVDPVVIAALVNRLTDNNGLVRDAAAKALAGCDNLAATTVLVDRLNDSRWRARLPVVEVLARRDDPSTTAALVECLGDRDQSVLIAAVEALARRDDPAAAIGLVNCLDDFSDDVRNASVKTLTSRESVQDLLALANKMRHVSRYPGQDVFDAAEELTSRYYRRIESTMQPTVRVAMAQLTATLADDST